MFFPNYLINKIINSPAWHSRSDYKDPKKYSLMDFDLFQLNQMESINSVVYFRGESCRFLFGELIHEVCLKKKCNRKKLCAELTEKFNTGKSTFEKYIFSKDIFPVYLVKELINFLPELRKKDYFLGFNMGVEQFKFGGSKNWSFFPKTLTSELSWLMGAVAADGWVNRDPISRKERLGIIDFHKKALDKANLFFEKCFGFKGQVVKHRQENSWLLIVDSKAITKFFTAFLGFHYGEKVYDICEPEIIKESNYRIDFASGVLSFDGSVEMDGVVSLGCASENLVRDVYEIFKTEGLIVQFEKKETAKQTLFFVKSQGLLQHKDANKWISVFGIDIEKGQRLDALVNGFKEKFVSEEDTLARLKKFVNYTRRKECPIYTIFFTLKKEGSVKRQVLLKLTNLPHCTFYKYVWVLRKANIVSCYTGQFWRGFENVYKFNYDTQTWRVPMVS